MTEAERRHNLLVGLNFGLVYVLWGSTYLAIRIVVEHIPPAMMGGVRFLIAGAVMLAWCALTGRRVALTRPDFWRIALIAVLLLTGGNVTVGWAEKYVPSGLAALIVAVVPLWVALIETFVLKGERLLPRGMFGLLLGIAGLVVLLWPKIAGASGMQTMQLYAALGLIAASLSWATGSILSRRWDFRIDAFTATAWEMLIAGVVNMALALALGDHRHVEWTARSIGGLLYLIVAGSWIGFTAYIWLLNHVPTAKVATYAYVNPIVAVFLGWLLADERVDAFILAGTVIIVGSVWLVNTSKVHPPPPSPQPRELAPVEGAAD